MLILNTKVLVYVDDVFIPHNYGYDIKKLCNKMLILHLSLKLTFEENR